MFDPDHIASFEGARVAILGDVMLDHYVFGQVSRVSEEAPVPIMRVRSERFVLGGAANVAANVRAMGGVACLMGVVGADQHALRLVELLDAAGFPGAIAANLVTDNTRATILKTRYIGGHQQMVRIDREATDPLSLALEDQLIDEARAALSDCAVLVLSDYGKGVLSDRVLRVVLDSAVQMGRRVIVDPKRSDYAAYRGASFITPNRKELWAATGIVCDTDEACAQAAHIAFGVSGASILLTRSEKGMSLFADGLPPHHLATEAREVFDVSGAGDTVVASTALGLAAGLDVFTAMDFANVAAGIVVAKQGTATASPGELRAALARRKAGGDDDPAELVTLEAAIALRADWARQGLRVGFTNGCFDLVHPGHVSLLRQAAAQCDRLIVALNTDESVARLKGPSRPIQPLSARAIVIGALKGVDAVIGFAEATPLEVITALVPDVLVKGADYAESDVVGADIVKAHGGRVFLASLIDGQSTSAIAGRLGAPPKADPA